MAALSKSQGHQNAALVLSSEQELYEFVFSLLLLSKNQLQFDVQKDMSLSSNFLGTRSALSDDPIQNFDLTDEENAVLMDVLSIQ